MTTAIIPEVLTTSTQILETSPMTESEEKELVIVKTAIQTAYADKLERDLAIGAGLLQIFRRKLYRGVRGGRSWKEWLTEESADLTAGRGALGEDTAQRLRGFYQFRVELLQASAHGRAGVSLPTSPRQVRPLLGQLDSHPEAAIEMWKAACAQAGKGNVPTFDQVNRAALAYKANQDNHARRLSEAQQTAQRMAVQASINSREVLNDKEEEVETFAFTPPRPTSPAPSIPAWELEKDDSSIDAVTECRRITSALNDAFKSISTLRGILYSQINRHGDEYLQFLRQVDAGVYSLSNIDDQIAQLGEDVEFVLDLLQTSVGVGELAKATIDVSSIPSRQ
jgi:hypothetical protein